MTSPPSWQKKSFYILQFLLLCFISSRIQAEIFQWTDEKGNKHYSDKARQGAKQLTIQTGYSYYQVKKVYDGDTILLTNGNKIRFLGINTPEVEGRQKSAQTGGEEAKRWLQQKLKNKKVRLEKDAEYKDKYGRLLAHVFTEDNQHINFQLVEKGLASVNIYPPNFKYNDDLLKAEKQAELSGLGIWGYSEYSPKPASQINHGSYKGWQRVKGRVEAIRQTRKYSYLKLSETFAIKLANKSKALFPSLNSYKGKQIEVRGWINKHKNNYSLFVRHPSAIHIK